MTASATASARRPVQVDILDAAARCFMDRGYAANKYRRRCPQSRRPPKAASIITTAPRPTCFSTSTVTACR